MSDAEKIQLRAIYRRSPRGVVIIDQDGREFDLGTPDLHGYLASGQTTHVELELPTWPYDSMPRAIVTLNIPLELEEGAG